ncbi:MAG: ribbon-helix-helix protein, CopG family [Patescibacteria group bacterium]
MSLQRSIINISVPAQLEKKIKDLAAEEDKTISELLREAFRVYQFQRDWSKVRRWGDETTRKMGIESYDDIEKIAG